MRKLFVTTTISLEVSPDFYSIHNVAGNVKILANTTDTTKT